jgi:hypothetical protein
MCITIVSASGRPTPIYATPYASITEVIYSIASAAGADGLVRFFGDRGDPVSEVIIERDGIDIFEFDAVAEAEAAERGWPGC